MSQLSAHTRNLDQDGRASILLSRLGKGDPLAHPRLTVVGTLAKTAPGPERDRLRARFLARHPKAGLYADFGDFAFWRMRVEGAHLNGGFAKAADFPAADVLSEIADARALIEAEGGAIEHLNADHADALNLYAQKLQGERAGRWRATGIDPDGLDLAAGDLATRLAFPTRITEPGSLRAVLVDFAARARQG